MGILFAYVEGSDFDTVAERIRNRFSEFSLVWDMPEVSVVDHKSARTPDLKPGDQPDWQLGLNISFEFIPRAKVLELVNFLSTLATETGREFVVGSCNTETTVAEDWCSIGSMQRQSVTDMLVEQLA
jgi:hypothetical protein